MSHGTDWNFKNLTCLSEVLGDNLICLIEPCWEGNILDFFPSHKNYFFWPFLKQITLFMWILLWEVMNCLFLCPVNEAKQWFYKPYQYFPFSHSPFLEGYGRTVQHLESLRLVNFELNLYVYILDINIPNVHICTHYIYKLGLYMYVNPESMLRSYIGPWKAYISLQLRNKQEQNIEVGGREEKSVEFRLDLHLNININKYLILVYYNALI